MLIDSDDTHKEYVQALETYEKHIQDSSQGRASNVQGTCQPLDVLDLKKKSARMCQMPKGIFWPEDVYLREKGVALKREDCVQHYHGDLELWGAKLPESEGVPLGAIRMLVSGETSVERATRLLAGNARKNAMNEL